MAKPMMVAEYFARCVEVSGKTLREIANEAGFNKPNILSMMKLGHTKIPVDRVPALARACNVDEAHFMKMVLREYSPEVWSTIVSTIGEPVTEREKELIGLYRQASPDETLDPAELFREVASSQ